jgi:two-component system, NarL family, sensor kinase
VSVSPAAAGAHDLLLFAVGRELLGNVARHADAGEVALVVSQRDDRIVMEVADDGAGMDLKRRVVAVREGHIGLAASRERVEAVGGRLEIESMRGAGTRVVVTLPLPECLPPLASNRATAAVRHA